MYSDLNGNIFIFVFSRTVLGFSEWWWGSCLGRNVVCAEILTGTFSVDCFFPERFRDYKLSFTGNDYLYREDPVSPASVVSTPVVGLEWSGHLCGHRVPLLLAHMRSPRGPLLVQGLWFKPFTPNRTFWCRCTATHLSNILGNPGESPSHDQLMT